MNACCIECGSSDLDHVSFDGWDEWVCQSCGYTARHHPESSVQQTGQDLEPKVHMMSEMSDR